MSTIVVPLTSLDFEKIGVCKVEDYVTCMHGMQACYTFPNQKKEFAKI